MQTKHLALSVFSFVLLTSTQLVAQTERGTVRGTVTDPTGAIVPEASLTITHLATNIERRVMSDSNGNFEGPDLQPGIYRVKADKAGFRGYVADNLLLDSGQVRRIDVVLQVGSTAETVNVSAGAALIQTDAGAISGDLDT